MRTRHASDFLGDAETTRVTVVNIGSDTTPLVDDMVFSDLDPRYGSRALSSRLDSARPLQEVIKKISDGELVPIDGYSLSRVVATFPKNSLTILEQARNDGMHNQFFFVGQTAHIKPLNLLASILALDEKVIEEVLVNPDKEYTKFPLTKKSGQKRWINAPSERLKQIQGRIKDRILYKAWPTRYAHGFVNKRSIVTNANPHVGKQVVINMDIKGFFDTITEDMVKNALVQCLPSRYAVLVVLVARLCTIETDRQGEKVRVTPQGAPTSPVLSNLVARWLDFSLKGVAQNFSATYTRYADDMTFSSDNLRLSKAIPIIMKVVNNHGFWVNTKKTNVFRRGGRQIVTGLVVNDVVSVPRQERMEFRAHLHHIVTGKIAPADVNIDRIQGYANYIHMVNPAQGAPFVKTVAEIVKSIRGEPPPKKKKRSVRKGKKK